MVLVIKNPPANAGDARDGSLIPGPGKSPGVGNGNPLHSSCLENSMSRRAWWATILGPQRVGHAEWVHAHTHKKEQYIEGLKHP